MSMMGNEFSGLPIADLIGAPLNAACDAQIRLAKSTADFINSEGFNPETDASGDTKLVPRQVDFSFWKPLPLSSSEILASGIIEITGPSSSPPTNKEKINTITIGSTTIQCSVNFSDVDKTLKEIINKINSDGNYQAERISGSCKIKITAKPGTGASLNGKDITVDAIDLNFTNGKIDGGKDAATPGSGQESQVQKVMLSVPFLALVNVPSLMVKTVDITFDMEVKSSESHHDADSQEVALDATAKVGWGPVSANVKVHGSVSSHKENTRSTDRSAKYHVQVQARDEGMPEGLSRVLDILQKSIAPVSTSNPVSLQTAKIAQNQKAVL